LGVRGGLVVGVVVAIVVVVVVVVVSVAIVVFVVVAVRADEGKVYFATGGCCFCVKVNVREEEAASASADGG
jgi:hypothetical protein